MEACSDGGCPPRLVPLNITCWHHASSKPRPAPRVWFVKVWFGCTAVFGQSLLLFDVVMEEVCCRFGRFRRRASSVTLPLPWAKLVSLDNQKFEQFWGRVCFKPALNMLLWDLSMFNSEMWKSVCCYLILFPVCLSAQLPGDLNKMHLTDHPHQQVMHVPPSQSGCSIASDSGSSSLSDIYQVSHCIKNIHHNMSLIK